ncbi:ABC transporter ATP-binding protein [Natrinema sp. H-ect4]|uniref:ABC transporter ATP-binding protein n=1 Tax=Natrinema sp. H-ect4 TaxID=3242699 RepID=UPI0035A90468
MARSAATCKQPSVSSSIVTADDVTKIYRRGSKPGRFARAVGRSAPPTVSAVDSVSVTVSNEEIVGLAGPSGSGKSTLLHLLAGLEQPTDGTVSFQETDLATLSKRERTRHRLEHIGIVFQQFHLLDSLSARANVALPLVELGVSKRQRRKQATELLEQVGLKDRITHRPRELSGGEQQRVAIARALVTGPALVVADEPTGELDTETGRAILQAFKQVAENRAVVLASHDQETLEICDRVIRLQDGTITERPTEETPTQ